MKSLITTFVICGAITLTNPAMALEVDLCQARCINGDCSQIWFTDDPGECLELGRKFCKHRDGLQSLAHGDSVSGLDCSENNDAERSPVLDEIISSFL